MSKITVIGSLNMDLVVNTPRVPVMGETILGNGFMTASGGKGANQAVAAARLGGDVSMIGCVGDDLFGRDLVRTLIINGVNTDNVTTIDGISTGIAMVVVNEGDNFIIVDPGANYKLLPEAIDMLEEHIRSSYMIIVQLEIPMETVERVIHLAKKHGVKVLLNPAPARQLSDELLSSIDIFTPNESECELITGLKVESIDDVVKAVKHLAAKGIPQVVVTMGSRGVVYNDGAHVLHTPVPKVNVVDTTAAGDSFSGALAVALCNGKTINESISFSNAVGTLTVTRRGAQTSLPTLEEVNKHISIA